MRPSPEVTQPEPQRQGPHPGTRPRRAKLARGQHNLAPTPDFPARRPRSRQGGPSRPLVHAQLTLAGWKLLLEAPDTEVPGGPRLHNPGPACRRHWRMTGLTLPRGSPPPPPLSCRSRGHPGSGRFGAQEAQGAWLSLGRVTRWVNRKQSGAQRGCPPSGAPGTPA